MKTSTKSFFKYENIKTLLQLDSKTNMNPFRLIAKGIVLYFIGNYVIFDRIDLGMWSGNTPITVHSCQNLV